MKFTVIGLSIPDEGLAVAGVVYGDVDLADVDHANESLGYSRWALTVDAPNVAAAEAAAQRAWTEEIGL